MCIGLVASRRCLGLRFGLLEAWLLELIEVVGTLELEALGVIVFSKRFCHT